jgi:N-acetyl-anhydromuramyl-L-alanine amidase AmpD
VAYPFVPSPFINKTSGRRIDLIVIHTMEMDEKGSTAESCAAWFQNPAAGVSAHYCVDNDTIVQCVQEDDVAWHAPGANHDGIGIEHAGRAKQTGREWGDDYSVAMLDRSTTLAAEICKRYGIPAVWLNPPDLLAGKRGITSHNNVSKAFKKGTHWDPGEGFPIQQYLTAVRKKLGAVKEKGQATEPLKPDPPTLKRGSDGWQVKRLQKLLRQRNLFPEDAKIDGDFGPITEAAVQAFQTFAGLDPDGIVGPMTWHALQTAPVTVPAAKPQLQPA